MEIVDVIIATPGSMLCHNYVKSLVNLLSVLNEKNITYKYINCQGSPVNVARENIVKEISKYNFKKIIWIDSDIGFTSENFLKLYNSDKDIIAGAYLLADGVKSTICPIGSNSELTKLQILKLTEPMRVQSIGFGFVAISNKVFNAIQKPHFELINAPVGFGVYVSLGEDISFCIKAKNLGFDIWFDPNILVNHMKIRQTKKN